MKFSNKRYFIIVRRGVPWLAHCGWSTAVDEKLHLLEVAFVGRFEVVKPTNAHKPWCQWYCSYIFGGLHEGERSSLRLL